MFALANGLLGAHAIVDVSQQNAPPLNSAVGIANGEALVVKPTKDTVRSPASRPGRWSRRIRPFARNAYRAIALATDCVDDLVVTGAQLLDREVSAECHVAKETHTRVKGHPLIDGGDGVDLLIRCHTATNQAEWRRRPIEQI